MEHYSNRYMEKIKAWARVVAYVVDSEGRSSAIL